MVKSKPSMTSKLAGLNGKARNGSGAGAQAQTAEVTRQEVLAAGGTVAYLETVYGFSSEDASNCAHAVSDFTGIDYSYIREIQRGEYHGQPPEYLANSARDIDRLVELAPKWGGGATYRGVGGKSAEFAQVGDIISMGGTASWSTKQRIASQFATSHASHGSVPTIYRAKTQSLATSVGGFSKFESEHEVASHSAARYRVTNIEYGTHHGTYFRYIDVEPI